MERIERRIGWTDTRRCLICDRLEYPDARIIHVDKVWLCPKCKAALQFIVEETIEGGKEDDNRT